ncbi:MAG: efflux RND transporter periplasmic adaptor subunit [Planctomycetota bacterium]
MKLRRSIVSTVLLSVVAGTGLALAAWKHSSLAAEAAAAAAQPEPMESVTGAVAVEREHVRTTTSIGTVLALRSITLRNELAGTVRKVVLETGKIVEAGTVLVALDVSVEEAELHAQEAQARLAETLLGRMQRASETHGASAADVDRALAQRDVALANVERTKGIIERKTIRAPFQARVGMADVHPGQYLNEGTELTTLQGVDDAVNVDFTVAQQVAAALHVGDLVTVLGAADSPPFPAAIVAIDARVDPMTRNAMVRARIEGPDRLPVPGSSVRVHVPIGAPVQAVVVPVSALRKGPAGDHVFVLAPQEDGRVRAVQRTVASGPVLGDEVVIESGLAAGEEVAASGSFKLREGVLVAVTRRVADGER